MNNELLKISNLTTTFRTIEGVLRAVDDISFSLGHNEVLGIVGESGSGKSVTALSVMQLINARGGKITAGKAIYNNGISTDLLQLDEKEMQPYRGKDIAMIFQEPMSSLNPVMTCGKQVTEAMLAHLQINQQEAREKTIHLFNKVKLSQAESVYDCYPHQLSGGQKQRVMIAMALSCNPKILIADEPTTALDVTVQAAILKLLKDLQKETNMSIIFITHDLGVISRLANRVLVMYKGRIVEHGTIDQVFKNPLHPYTKGLLACRPSMHTGSYRLPVISDFMEVDEEGIIISKNSISADLNLLFENDVDTERKKYIYNAAPLIEVSNLSVLFEKKKGFFGKTTAIVKAVDDVSFHIYKGETLGLVGESGCGKTTIGRALLNLVKSKGSVLYNGKNILECSKTEMRLLRKKFQMIFQDPLSSLNPRLTVGEAILEPIIVHSLYNTENERKDKVMWLLDKVGLSAEHYNRYPHEFSGGQRQRIGIARALALNPELIICDECVSALDVSVQAQVLNLLNDLKKEFGFTCIFISHDLSVVRFMSDRMMVMNNGQIVEEGITDAVYRNPQSEYTRKLIDAIPAL